MDSPGKGEYLVSVVVPAFNAERHISTSLESLCRQTLAGSKLLLLMTVLLIRLLQPQKQYCRHPLSCGSVSV